MTLTFNKLEQSAAEISAPFGEVALPNRGGLYRNSLKRILDMVAIVATLPIVLPVVALLALCVAMHGHQPFYRSKRVGRGGRDFDMIKLRTMVPDADTLLEDYLERNPSAREEWDRTQKLKNDPRITPIGQFLRRTSLDELPQLWNVFVGDMSLVGPRPMLPEQRVLYPGLAYYALRPGLTGSWQVSERNQCTFQKRAEHDRAYERDLTFSLDLNILFKTVGVVLKGTGY